MQRGVALGHLKLDDVAGQNPADTLAETLLGRMIREWSENVGQKWLQRSQRCSSSNSKFEKYRMVTNERTLRIEWRIAERQRSRVKWSRGQGNKEA